MPQTLLILALTLAAQIPQPTEHVELVCRFTAGPLAGQQMSLGTSTSLKPGQTCSNGASTGIVSTASAPPHAGLGNIFDKYTHLPSAGSGAGTVAHPPVIEHPGIGVHPVPPPPPAGPPPIESHAPGAAAAPPPQQAKPPAVEVHAGPPPQQTEHYPMPAPHAPSPPAQEPPPPVAAAPPPAIIVHSGGEHAAPAAPDELREVHQWYESLEKGSAAYTVPASMVLGQTYSATAVIHPPTSPTPADPNAHPLKISPYMRIVLNQTANPGTFEIKPADNDCKFVSMDADTTWVFNVKPLLPGKDRTLDFAAYVVYGTGDGTCRPENLKTIDILTQTETVSISALTWPEFIQKVTVDFLSDPGSWFKFILPGGAGFITISGLIAWWKKRKAAKAETHDVQHAPEAHAPSER